MEQVAGGFEENVTRKEVRAVLWPMLMTEENKKLELAPTHEDRGIVPPQRLASCGEFTQCQVFFPRGVSA